MNETITLSPRQKAIINSLAKVDNLSREQLASQIADLFPASKATLSRDLAELIENKLITAVGQGPNRAYRLAVTHPLLKPVDLDIYFAQEPDLRLGVNKSFNPQVLTLLTNLFDSGELGDLERQYRSFSVSKSSLESTVMKRELERFVIELSWKSSKIEGNTYTLLETETLIKESRKSPGRTKFEADMILNHKRAFEVILENVNDFKTLTLTKITQLHQVLTQNLKINSGLREQAVGITGTTYQPPDNVWQIKQYLQELIQVINNKANPLEKALISASMVPYLQPFADGNKRTARMLTNAILMAHDYFPLSYRSIDIDEFKSALILFYETQNLYHLKRLFVEQYLFALKTYFV